MEDTATLTAEAQAAGQAGAVESASPPQQQPSDNSQINAIFRAAAAGVAPTSNPAAVVPTAELTDAPTGQSDPAQSGDVKADGPTEQAQPQQKLPRRAPKEIANKQTIEGLQAEIARRDAEAETERARIRDEVRHEVLAEQQQQSGVSQVNEDAARYDRLVHTQDHLLDRDDLLWREEYKQKLALFPEVAAHHEATTRARISSAETAFMANMRAQITAAGDLPGVDLDAFRRPGTTFTDMARAIHAAGAATARSESAERIAELEAENGDLKRQALGAISAPVEGGRSGGQGGLSGGDWFRQSLLRARAG